MDSDTSPPNKRERTRARLISCAIDLFEQHGYEQTTVPHIAQRAGVQPVTFFRHFPSKHQVLFEDPYDPVIASMVAAQPPQWNPLKRTIHGFRAAWQHIPEPESDLVRRRIRIVADTPSLHGHMWANNAATEQLVIKNLIANGTDAPSARIAAASVLAALMAAIFAWAHSETHSLSEAINHALDLLETPDGTH
ncbi:TetR/AcrR family transcriptional regulator [Natronoglycomyces albus]|uniref:TetR family transcriptional regulator n=1 Tax=Natronoglycomyces albus TaxID=2811108 RepID=A0A895XTZ9_9ACTN|nr:TetR/AcrR family transcriptional regulator [Natronoglycomyces albus]QSB06805.1 TetR family transcriptional regulator [Natronoglycomyces albus]